MQARHRCGGDLCAMGLTTDWPRACLLNEDGIGRCGHGNR
ncbi:hypothetical protein KC8_00320 [Sphingomonas sp. KC8]|nr:hypothetical protein KC8_00320 [Sphingomonas sp. KC8]